MPAPVYGNAGRLQRYSTEQMTLGDGLVSGPIYTFTSDPDTGVWRIGTGAVGIAGDGLQVIRFQAPGGVNPQVIVPMGTAANPPISFDDTFSTAGFYQPAAGTVGFVSGAAERWRLNSGSFTAISSDAKILSGVANQALRLVSSVTNGTTDPAFVFDNNSVSYTASTGLQRIVRIPATILQTGSAGSTALEIDVTNTTLGIGAHRFLDLKIGGSTVFAIKNSSSTDEQGQVQLGSGAVGSPSLSFITDNALGVYRIGAGILGVSANGLEVARYQAPSGANPQLKLPLGTTALPSLSFGSSNQIGLSAPTANQLNVTTNNILTAAFNYLGTTIYYNGTGYVTFGAATATFQGAGTYSLHCLGTQMGLIIGGRRDTSVNAAYTNDASVQFTQYANLAFVGAASTTQRMLRASAVVNQTSTAAFNMLELDVTNTALGSGAQNFLDLKVAGTTIFTITNGTTTASRGRMLAGPGAAATPSISFYGDPDTGLTNVSANTVSVVTGGTEAWRFNGGDFNSYVSGAYIQQLAADSGLTFSGNIGATTSPSFGFENFNSFTGGTGVNQRFAVLGAAVNQTSTAGFSFLQLNATNTALGSGAQYFLDVKVGGTTVAAITNGSTSATQGRLLAGAGASATPSLSFLGQTADGFYSQSSTNIGATGNLNPDITATWSLGTSVLRWNQVHASTVVVNELSINSGGEVIGWPYTTMHFHGKDMLFDNAGEEYWIDTGGHFYSNSDVAYAVTRNSKVYSVNVNIYVNTLDDDAEFRLCINGSFFAAALIPFGFVGTIDMSGDFDGAGLTYGDVFNWACTGTEKFPAGTLSLTVTHQLRSQ